MFLASGLHFGSSSLHSSAALALAHITPGEREAQQKGKGTTTVPVVLSM